ncbi:threonine dehydrogenase-like Zn-dependent dehydrogenase [Actinoplanes lutulentus]|uniref:Threonine dehydrogenase-like Zn-dependent dehydrogenase n=1 Tax=Actinoplanes lutulentus TaxID=1287878 RepID=A0A327Z298_9ACTN|nr:alcohol dehydrogenase catalytic domain-containing protein [Actinoplanes lutulentus]MBB2946327.1 threonine dehydrogenase-like Zn-dependent dehydrogenase [Actinoplanes lutulentus]RAK28734.1 threonine dehydrogenase-like Zn-dependent dehydrogenase [Actinoplanes lutulentus]
MRATLYGGPGDITVGERPDPRLRTPGDAIVRVTLGCVCGSDLWYYRGVNPHALGPIGHEFIGVIEQAGADVTGLKPGDLVVAPFTFCDGTCANCAAGWTGNCLNGGSFGNHGVDGGQGEYVRVPFADATLVKVPGSGHSDAVMKSLVALSDVMCTGHHAAVSAGVKPGDTVAVVGDGAVGLCGVIAAKRLGAERIISLSRNPVRQALAREFGATDVLTERGDDAIKLIMEMTGGIGVDAALECVGTGESMATAFGVARVGAVVGAVGVPHDSLVPLQTVIFRNVGLRGGIAPARRYIPELLDDVLAGRINPGLVLDYETDLDGIGDAYAAMLERRATKSLVRVGAGVQGAM